MKELEKTDKILKNFFDKNKDYAIELIVGPEAKPIGNFLITVDRSCFSKDNIFAVSWQCQMVKLDYNDVTSVKKDKDEFGIETVRIKTTQEITWEFICVGMRI